MLPPFFIGYATRNHAQVLALVFGAKVALPGNLASDRAVLPESWGDYP